jgi:FkbM family methyltransferase
MRQLPKLPPRKDIMTRVRRMATAQVQLERRVWELENDLYRARRKGWKYDEPPMIELDYPNAEILLDASTKLSRKRKNATKKEPRTVEWIESLPAGEVLYDIGANVGAYSLIAAKRPQGAMKIAAFEPAFGTYALLCRNIVTNQAGDEIMPFSVVLGETTALGSFGYTTLVAGAGLHAGLGASGSDAWDQPVLVFALDDLVSQFDLPFPNHIKLDVDGAEVEILRGARKTLSDPRVKTVLAEIFTRFEPTIDPLMAECGLQRVDTLRSGEAAGEPFLYALYRR